MFLHVQVGVFVFRRYRKKNIKSMNFDNPVYRKTTTDDDKVYMEKTGSRQNLPSVRNLILVWKNKSRLLVFGKQNQNSWASSQNFLVK